MPGKRAWLRGGLLTLTLAAGALTVPAAASAAPTAPVDSLDSLVLTIAPSFPSGFGQPRQVTLLCEPTGGDHPDAEAACADLIAAGGDVTRIPPVFVFCTANYDPVNATASGNWRGRPIFYAMQFPNTCVANVTTGGHVFHF